METPKNILLIYKYFIRFKNCILLFFILQIALVLVFIFTCNMICNTCYLRLSTKVAFSSVVQYRDLISIKNKKNHEWCRLQKWRVNWKGMIGSCEGKMAWEKREVNSWYRTDPDKSYIKKWDLQNAGKFSKLWIQSVSKKGHIKTFGGDSWRIYVRQGPQSIAPIVIDHDNGLYEVVMLITEPGNYSANIYLDYTLCDGLREPPTGWFINGTDYGTYLDPKEGILGNIEHDHINRLLNSFNFTIHGDASSSSKKALDDQGCYTKCSLLWDGYGYWKENEWFLYESKHVASKPPSNHQAQTKRSGTLWVYGDSLGMRFIDSMKEHPLCTSIFDRCGYTYNWIYEVKDKRHPLKVRTEFNKTVVINKIRQLLENQDINQPDSIFVFSLGVHFPISLSFSSYQDLIESVILLLNEKKNGRKAFQGTAVWKSTTAIEKHKITRIPWPAKPLNYTMFRFLTTQRNQLFHTFSMSAMCKADIKVLDVYPLSTAFHQGTLDYVHYNDTVFYPAANVIKNYAIASRRRRQENTKE
ncbi:uncharacterized protein LOC116287413 [Actinia tenebrosa]|uniref:Uncharacterized protein LOC116287413 n=1 Tax=Actinia tenebrosa TaxID=6105 RepID=A0A6P8H0J1_ACTTE|nr:uncharacterized protein LOC116287413 [Actinia tenebrosa]